jgi:N-acetylglucosamine-6-phosphate deacetylase
MATALVNARVLTPQGLVDGCAVVVQDDRISGVVPAADLPASMPRRDLRGGLLAPGFVDVQVNGGGGALFNDAPTVETIRTIGGAHRRFGATGFLPTLISDDLDKVAQALDAVDAAIQAGVPGVLGVHLEGPFLSARRRGTHDDSKFRVLDEAACALIAAPRRGKVMITLAPEAAPAVLIRRLADAGVIVSLGHTDARYAQTRAALDAGARGFTHLFNAMSQLGSREPGVVGAALDDEDSFCGIIVDGRHVAAATLRVALKAKRRDRFMLVTDAMPSVGGPKTFQLQGRTIRVRDGVCVDQAGVLSGSDLDMASAVRNAAAMLGLPLEDALRMAAHTPAAFLGLERDLGEIASGRRADLVLLSPELEVIDTWIGGRAASDAAPTEAVRVRS